MTLILSKKGRYQGVYQLQCSSKSYVLVIIDYFNRYKLYGIKYKQFYKWKRFVYYRLLACCSSKQDILRLKNLIKIFRSQ